MESFIRQSSQGLRSVTGQSADVLVIGPNSTECTVSQVLLLLWDGDSSGTQKRKSTPLEDGTQRLVWDNRSRGLSACIVNYRLTECNSARDCNCANWRKRHSKL
jgi:hypothetical protein